MPKRIADPELAEYHDRIGAEEYKKQYTSLYEKTKYNRRYSRRKYENSDSRIQALKEKYKNGVPKGEINKMLGIKEKKNEV